MPFSRFIQISLVMIGVCLFGTIGRLTLPALDRAIEAPSRAFFGFVQFRAKVGLTASAAHQVDSGRLASGN